MVCLGREVVENKFKNMYKTYFPLLNNCFCCKLTDSLRLFSWVECVKWGQQA